MRREAERIIRKLKKGKEIKEDLTEEIINFRWREGKIYEGIIYTAAQIQKLDKIPKKYLTPERLFEEGSGYPGLLNHMGELRQIPWNKLPPRKWIKYIRELIDLEKDETFEGREGVKEFLERVKKIKELKERTI